MLYQSQKVLKFEIQKQFYLSVKIQLGHNIQNYVSSSYKLHKINVLSTFDEKFLSFETSNKNINNDEELLRKCTAISSLLRINFPISHSPTI